MKIRIVKNKYVNALLVLMLLSALVHMLILSYFSIKSKNLYALNYFNILDVDLFYASIFDSAAGNVFSVLFVIFIYFIILKINRHEP